MPPLTRCLNSSRSSRVSVSALAITGTTLTILLSLRMNSRSRGRSLVEGGGDSCHLATPWQHPWVQGHRRGAHQCPVGGMKYTQPCTRLSGIFLLRVMRISSRRYRSYCSLMYLMMGSQLGTGDGSEQPRWGLASPKCHHSGRFLPVVVVDLVPKSRRVRHRQLHLHTLLLDDCGISGIRALSRSRRPRWGSLPSHSPPIPSLSHGFVDTLVTLPWVTDCSCTVFGMRSSWPGCEALRLTLDLKRVFTMVDFPSPLCPVRT